MGRKRSRVGASGWGALLGAVTGLVAFLVVLFLGEEGYTKFAEIPFVLGGGFLGALAGALVARARRIWKR